MTLFPPTVFGTGPGMQEDIKNWQPEGFGSGSIFLAVSMCEIFLEGFLQE